MLSELYQQIEKNAKLNSKKCALIAANVSLSYGALIEVIEELSAALKSGGVVGKKVSCSGDRLGEFIC